MPDLPQGAPQPGGPQPPQGGQQGGGIVEALTMVDQTLTKITQALGQNQQIPPNVKSAAQAALQAFRQFEQALLQSAGGGAGGDQDGDEGGPGGATTPQQGASGGAVPMSHQNMRGG